MVVFLSLQCQSSLYIFSSLQRDIECFALDLSTAVKLIREECKMASSFHQFTRYFLRDLAPDSDPYSAGAGASLTVVIVGL